MLTGPPRLLSLVSIPLLLILVWCYVRAAQTFALPSFGSGASRSKPSSSYVGDPLDFGIPIRFKDGEVKPRGSNYTWAVVIPKTKKEDISWMHRELPDMPVVVYEVDNPNAKYKVPKNKGREAMVYLTYMIDHYDSLPDTVIFMHAHRHAWHNNLLMGQDAAIMLKRLNHERVARMGYMNVRCHHEPGCPDWIHMDRPGGDFDFYHKPEEIHWRRQIWEEIHPGAPVPPTLSGVCCAQFALSRERIQQVPIERLVHYRKWLMNTPMDDQYSGRVFEYIWHYIFTGHEVYCPAQNTCYCDGYGICFGGRQNYEDYWAKQKERDKQFGELDTYNKRQDKAKEEGKDFEFNSTEKARMDELTRSINALDGWLSQQRAEAFRRGEDPKARKEETESWDSTHIWDYAPKSGV